MHHIAEDFYIAVNVWGFQGVVAVFVDVDVEVVFGCCVQEFRDVGPGVGGANEGEDAFRVSDGCSRVGWGDAWNTGGAGICECAGEGDIEGFLKWCVPNLAGG